MNLHPPLASFQRAVEEAELSDGEDVLKPRTKTQEEKVTEPQSVTSSVAGQVQQLFCVAGGGGEGVCSVAEREGGQDGLTGCQRSR